MRVEEQAVGAIRAILIPANQCAPLSIIEFRLDADDPRYRPMAKAIGASYAERVYCALTYGHSLVLVVDKNGRMTSPPKPFNLRADKLHVGGHVRGIHGDALVAAESWGLDFTDYITIPDPDATLVLVEQWRRP